MMIGINSVDFRLPGRGESSLNMLGRFVFIVILFYSLSNHFQNLSFLFPVQVLSVLGYRLSSHSCRGSEVRDEGLP